MNITDILPIFQMVLTTMNIAVLGFGFYKFLNHPHDTLEKRVNEHDIKLHEIEKSLLQGNDRFRDQDDTNEVLINSTLALIEFEIQYCLTEKKPMSKDLEKAKDNLHGYLAKR